MQDFNRTRPRSRLKQKSPSRTTPVSVARVSRIDKMVLISKALRLFFFGLLALVILTPVLFLWYSRDLPTPGKLVDSKYKDASGIYDKNGVLLYSVYTDVNRTYVNLDNISPLLQKATIAIEDKDFYTNSGFSPIAYLRVIKNVLLGNGLGGGSTITQQLVKNVLLTNERSLPRKIKELILAIQVDKKYSKNQILEMYLNNIPYGGPAVGIEAASETYFGKKAKDLDLGQSAFLAGLPQLPSLYSPFSGDTYYIGRTDAVLSRMLADKEITKAQKDAALKEIKDYTFTQQNGSIKAPYFVMYVRSLLQQQFGDQMNLGGLKIETTLDYTVEEKVEQIIEEQIAKLKGYNVGNGAAMVTDPKTGAILAMAGGKDYFGDSQPEGCTPGKNCVFEPNVNLAVSPRQPGSSMKPVVYAAAFEKGMTPASMVMDVKTDFPSGDPSNPTYTPVNYDGTYHGPVQLRFALGNSLNIPAVKVLAMVGIKPAMQKAYDMGINEWEPTNANVANVGLSLVLGGRETTLYNEMEAYGVFANAGIRQDLFAISKVTDSKGDVLYEHKDTSGRRVLSAEISYLISHILLDNNARTMEFGPNSYLVVPGKTVSVKTGTTDEKRDNWTYGYTPSYVVGVWVGNDNREPMNQKISSGITGASPIWQQIMINVLKGKPDQAPVKPDNVVAVQVDSFVGGLPHGGMATRSEYFVKGTEPTSESPVYKAKDGKNYFVFKESDPVSTDGVNRWQQGIDAWIEQNHKGEDTYHPPDDLKNQ
jgi:membrane peptidoglycan carboxypeptidase